MTHEGRLSEPLSQFTTITQNDASKSVSSWLTFGAKPSPHPPITTRLARLTPDHSIPTRLNLCDTIGRHLLAPYDQKDLACCVAICLSTLFHFQSPHFCPSPLYIYYYTRAYTGIISRNLRDCKQQPTSIEDNLLIALQGLVCLDEWPFDTKIWDVKPPAPSCAMPRLLSWHNLDHDLMNLKTAICAGKPFMFILQIYQGMGPWLKSMTNCEQSFAVDKYVWPNDTLAWTGKLSMSHAMTCFGFDDAIGGGCFIIRSSWGKNWAHGGHAYLPYGIMTGAACSDFLVLHEICWPDRIYNRDKADYSQALKKMRAQWLLPSLLLLVLVMCLGIWFLWREKRQECSPCATVYLT